MVNLSFTTQPLSSTSEYQIVDTSTSRTGYDHKFITIYGQDGTTILYQDMIIPLTTDVIKVSTTSWTLTGLLQIVVILGYVPIGNGADSLSKSYLLPTTLNLAV